MLQTAFDEAKSAFQDSYASTHSPLPVFALEVTHNHQKNTINGRFVTEAATPDLINTYTLAEVFQASATEEDFQNLAEAIVKEWGMPSGGTRNASHIAYFWDNLPIEKLPPLRS